MRVLLASDSLEPSGVGVHMLALASGLRRLNHDPVIALHANDSTAAFMARARHAGVAVTPVAPEAWVQVICALKPDLVHIHAGIGWEGHEICRAARACERVIVRTEHLPWLLTDPVQIAEYAQELGHIAALICVSPSARASWSRGIALMKGPQLPLATVANGIAPSPNSPWNRAVDDPLMILCVGRLAAQKQQGTLLIALARLRRSGVLAQVQLVGTGPMRPKLQRLAQRLGIEDVVHFLGQREDVPALMARATLLVMPSVFEGLPLVVLEAMAAGLPVVASQIGGNRDALGPDHPWLFPPRHARPLGQMLADAFADPAARTRIAQAQADRQRHAFTGTRMATETAALYRAALTAKRGKVMDKVKLGFIGAGGIAHRHFDVLATMQDVVITAIADPDPVRAQEAAARLNATPYADHQTMLAGEDLDAVFICIPPFAHGAPEQACLARRLPFLVEKPLSLDLAVAEEIAAAVERAAVVTAVGYHWRYLDTVDEARKHLASNPPHLIQGFWIDQTPPPQWWWREDKSGGQIVEQATHLIDTARFLAGDVTEVFGVSARRDRDDFVGLTGPTASAATLKFASGAVASLAATCLLRWSHRVGLHVYSDSMAIELSEHDIMVDVGQGRPLRAAQGDPVWRQDRDFIDAVMGRENRIRCPYPEALKTHRVALAVSHAARDGQVVTMEGLQADLQPMFRKTSAPRPDAAASNPQHP